VSDADRCLELEPTFRLFVQALDIGGVSDGPVMAPHFVWLAEINGRRYGAAEMIRGTDVEPSDDFLAKALLVVSAAVEAGPTP